MKEETKSLNVIINSPDKLIWEGIATSVSSENTTGAFDILPGHANFVTIIENKPIIVRSGRQPEKKFLYDNAVIVIKGVVLTVYVDV